MNLDMPYSTLARFAAVGLLAALSLGAAPPAPTQDSPLKFVEGRIDHFAKILASKQKNRETKLKHEVRSVFDFDGFAQDTLGTRWSTLKKTDQKKFSSAVRTLIESVYLKNPSKLFDKHVVQLESETREDDSAEVSGNIKQDDVDIEIVLKLKKTKLSWVVRDVVFDDLSLLEDYQYQFRSYLKKKTLAQLISTLSTKAKENKKKKTS